MTGNRRLHNCMRVSYYRRNAVELPNPRSESSTFGGHDMRRNLHSCLVVLSLSVHETQGHLATVRLYTKSYGPSREAHGCYWRDRCSRCLNSSRFDFLDLSKCTQTNCSLMQRTAVTMFEALLATIHLSKSRNLRVSQMPPSSKIMAPKVDNPETFSLYQPLGNGSVPVIYRGDLGFYRCGLLGNPSRSNGQNQKLVKWHVTIP
jgi:hypothetical protein